jgi:histidinol dehydrogenase
MILKLHKNPSGAQLADLLERPVKKSKEIRKTVKPILKKVRKNGDTALIKAAREYDHVEIHTLAVSPGEFRQAANAVSDGLKEAIETAYRNIEAFHRAQADAELEIETMPGVLCRRKSVPISRVGLYVPGGSAPLFSTVLMLGIPALVAGCETIVLCTPPGKQGRIHPVILYTAQRIGIRQVFKVGGAQAIAAMAYGTESIPRVFKIFGPGNQYVTAAKQMVAQEGVAIDLPAGPSELAVYADESAVPDFVASDLLAQAEHGPDSQVLLLSTRKAMIEEVQSALVRQLPNLPRRKIAEEALANSHAILVDTGDQAIDIINRYAAEHLILAVRDPEQVAARVFNAGSVFLGNYTPEAAGDYASGTNHTLPTNRAALAYSGVSLDSFVKKITYQTLTEEGIRALGPPVELMAEAEHLLAHKLSVTFRLDYLNKRNGS